MLTLTPSSESFEPTAEAKAAAALISEPKTNTTPLYSFATGTLTEGSPGRWQNVLTSHFKDLDEPRSLRSLSRDLTRQARASPYHSFAASPALTPNLKRFKTALVFAKPKLCLVFAGQGPQHIYMGRQLSGAFLLSSTLRSRPAMRFWSTSTVGLRSNPKVPVQNAGEHFQFLEGTGNLLMTGYKHIEINKLTGRSDGISQSP